jgi:hypothetical protein
MIRFILSRTFLVGAACLALGFACAFPIAFWGTAKAPEFYAALTTALITAVALLLGYAYQAALGKRREDEARRRKEVGEAIELYYWLEHSINEMGFIEDVLVRMRDRATEDKESRIKLPADQFKEIISSKIFPELLARAKLASQLPPAISASVTRAIYGTFTISDRIFMLRGAGADFLPSVEDLEKFIVISQTRQRKLQSAADTVREHLATATQSTV